LISVFAIDSLDSNMTKASKRIMQCCDVQHWKSTLNLKVDRCKHGKLPSWVGLGPVCLCGHRSRVPGNRDAEKPRFRRFSDKQRFSSFVRVFSLPRSLNARPPREFGGIIRVALPRTPDERKQTGPYSSIRIYI
jgi:hypothetical protein